MISKKAHPVLWFTSGFGLGYLAWHPEATQWWVLPLPLLWAASRTRLAAFLVWLGYYLAGARDVPAIFTTFFPESWPGWGAVIWLIHAALLAVPWAVFWRANATPRQAVYGAAAALLLSVLPPLGILGWLSPLLLAGEAFPGSGWAGLGMALTILALAAGCARRRWWAIVVLSLSTVLASLLANSWYSPPKNPDGWTAVDTSMGVYPTTDRVAAYYRHQAVMAAVHAKLKAGAKVIVLPEEIAGFWRAGTQFWWQSTEKLAREMNATLIVGADLPMPGQGYRYVDGAVLLGADTGTLHGRVPMPIGEWRPGQESSAIPDFFGRGTTHFQGVRVATSICYEDFLIYPLLLASLDRPQVIISMANNWFATDLGGIWIQRRSIENQARLFGVPLVRAVNLQNKPR